jgi:glycosyltransferase involved in cell wall biosynthesis
MNESTENKKCDIGIFVIAYNAEKHIEKTLSRIPPEVWDTIKVCYVVDDASTDETTRVAQSFGAYKDKLVVLRNSINKRYGGNQKFGYQWAMENNLDVVVMLHADGQYAPEMLPDIIGPLASDEADVVFGSRMINRRDALAGGMPKYKYVGNIVLTTIENFLTGMQLSEFHSGYRGYRIDFLRRIPLWENSDEWHFDTQILLQAHQAQARIKEVPIPTYYGDEICHVNGVAYGLNCILSAMFFRMHRSGIMYGRKYDIALEGRRYFEKFNDPYSSHTQLWQWLKEQPLSGKRVLELGVGDASLTRRLKEAGALVDGVDISEYSAKMASPFCHRSMVGNLDRMDEVPLELGYDIVIAADVLEHLVHPEAVLAELKYFAAKGALLYVSLPNIANLYVRLNLLLGRFPSHSKGLLDETHLHHYTLTSMRKLITKSGWVIRKQNVSAIPLPIVFPFLLRQPFRWIMHVFGGLTRLFKGLLGYQGLFICENLNVPPAKK